LKYIILLVAMILVFPILLYIARRKRISNQVIVGAIAGLVISIIGLVMQGIFDRLYVLVAMIGLAFAASVLLDKRSETKVVSVSKQHPVVIDSPREIGKYNHTNANEEIAASVNKEVGFAMEPIEDELNLWMSGNREEIESGQSEFYDREELSDGK
jgi:hypothetical protein